MERQNDKVLFGVMTIIFHSVGVPYFMRQKTKQGVLHIVLSIITFGVMGIVYEIQGIIRGVNVLKMTDEQYMAEKYADTPSFFSYH